MNDYMTVTTIGGQEHQIKLCGTVYNPYFCGKEVCEILGYSNHQDTIFKQVKEDHKKTLKTILLEVEKFNNGPIEPYGVQCNFHSTSLGDFDLENLSYNDGKVMFLSDHGVRDLLKGSENHKIFKEQFERFIYTIKYENNSGLMNIFSFIKGSPLAIDITSNWFQDLWYPLSKSQPPPGGGLTMVENQPVIVTQNLLEWMGYKGRDQADKQERFSRVLESLEIPYEEIDHRHPLAIEYPCVQREVESIPKNNLDRKRWISMDQRAFKKAVIRLNTKNADMIRDYYLNLEEAMMAYSHYTMNYMIEQRNYELSNTMAQLAIKDRAYEEAEERLEEERQQAEQAQKEAEERLEEERLRAEKAEKEAEEHKQYALFLKEHSVARQKRPLNQVIYISTSKSYAVNNRYKVGGIESMDKLNPRFSGYNGRSSIDDLWYCSDVFKVANFKACEKRIEDILGKFREQKNKELYVLHYDDLKRFVEYICEHYEDEIGKFNKEVDMLIDNLNKTKKKPVIPPKYQGSSVTITNIVDGIPTTSTIDSTEDKFKEKIKMYLNGLDPTIKELKKIELFDQVDFTFNKNNGWKWLKEVLMNHKPDINLKYR